MIDASWAVGAAACPPPHTTYHKPQEQSTGKAARVKPK
jgi:hypothetical protein